MIKIHQTFILLIVTIFFSHSQTRYYSVRIELDSLFTMNDFVYYGFDLESAVIKQDKMTFYADNEELNLIKKLNVKFVIDGNDPVEEYQKTYDKFINSKKSNVEYPLENDFRLGSMKGYFTLNEIYQIFDSLKIKYPEFVLNCDTIGYSIENRPVILYTVGASDKKNELLITALHHAREPGGASVLIYFIKDILSKAANNDPEAIYLLTHRTLYVVPVLNPDGYLFNQINNPEGGGLWRKNRRQINDSTWGVDLNRNYGPYEYWNAQVNGSSVKPSDATYRGSNPFSEPEIIAVRDFVLSHNIKLALNYHTYGNLVIYPYSALAKETDDSLFFRELGLNFTSSNRYLFGLDKETVNYSSRGSSDDWLYWTGEGKSKKIFSFTPEVGKLSDNFWTTPDRILEQCKENLEMNYSLMRSAEVNWILSKSKLSDDGTNILSSELKNVGIMKNNTKPDIAIRSLDSDFNILILNEETEDSIIKIKSKIESKIKYTNGYKLKIEYKTTLNEVDRRDTSVVELGQAGYIYLFHNENLFGSWNKGKWGVEFNKVRNAFVLSDSPGGFYSNSDTNYLSMKEQINLDFNSAFLDFASYWEIEPNYDFAVVEISPDSGKTWTRLDAKRMIPSPGTKDALIKLNETGYSGYSHDWIESEISLKDYLGKNVLFRFGLLSDKASNANGWLIDDLKLKIYINTTDIVNKSVLSHEIYPNPSPAGSLIRFTNLSDDNFKVIDVYDILGNKISYQFSPQDMTIKLIDEHSDFYLLKCIVNNQLLYFKVKRY